MEAALWFQLKGRKLDDIHFRRQCPFGPYILDFYCSAAKLAIELDGYSHGVEGAAAHDAARDAWLRAQGVETLRLSLSSINEDGIGAALSTILAEVRRRAPSVSGADSSPAGGRAQ